MSVVTVEPLVHGELLASKLTIKLPDSEGNYENGHRVNVLLNCGWSLDFAEEKLDVYTRLVRGDENQFRALEDLDLILVTDGDFAHSGALLWLVSRFRAESRREAFPKVLCTEGTYKFMRAAFIDVLENVTFTRNFEYYSVDDLEYFNAHCVKLSYRETYCLDKKFADLTVRTSFCPVNNGYSVGGALWLVAAGFNTIVCGDKIRIYPSTLLNGTSISDVMRPDLLLLSHEGAERPRHVSDPQGVEVCNDLDSLVDRLVTTLTNGGNVLFPVDVDYTLINLLIHLNMIWSTSHLSQFKIVLASPIADKLLLFIGTCLEYMKTSIFHNFIKTLWNPLMDLSRVDIITSLAHLSKYRFRPTLFISTTSSIDFGFSNLLFVAISSYHKNLVVLTKPNASVAQYIYNHALHAKQLPQYRLQINLGTGKKEQGEAEPDPETGEEQPAGYFDKFGNLGSNATFSNVQATAAQNADRDAKNTQDYGLPFNDLLADPSNPYGYTNMPKYEEAAEDQMDYAEEEDGVGTVDDYFRKYIDDAKNNIFDIDAEASHDQQPKTDLLVKKFPFVIKSQLFQANCFSNTLTSPQIPSLLYRTLPRNVVLVPSSTTSSESELELVRLLNCSLHSFDQHPKAKTKSEGGNESQNKLSPVTVNLNFNNYPVLLDSKLLSSVRNFFNKKPTTEIKKAPSSSLQGINSVFNAIQSWKHKNNREQTCQVVSRLTCVEEHTQDSAPPPRVLHCHTFWSDESSRRSRLEFTMEGCEDGQSQGPGAVKMGVDSTLLVGEVSMSNYARFVDDCLPNSITMDSGSAVINDKVRVAKHSASEETEWLVEGTLDPCFYLARKVLRKLHNRIEPIY